MLPTKIDDALQLVQEIKRERETRVEIKIKAACGASNQPAYIPDLIPRDTALLTYVSTPHTETNVCQSTAPGSVERRAIRDPSGRV